LLLLAKLHVYTSPHVISACAAFPLKTLKKSSNHLGRIWFGIGNGQNAC